MRIVFMGTPDFAVPVLKKLIDEHDVVAVYTRAPKECGRGKKITKTPVHQLAECHNIEVCTPKTLRDEAELVKLKSYNADVAIVAAYGLLLPQNVLNTFPLGCINVHASLLPRWRGAAPIQRAIEAGDDKSGITIMQMALELDAGDILSQSSVDITPDTTGEILHDMLMNIGADLLIDTLSKLKNISPIKQDMAKVCYAEKISKGECLIDFSVPAEKLEAKIRAFAPYPGLYFMYNGERFKILKASVVDKNGTKGEILSSDDELVIATGNKALSVEIIQRAGKQPMKIYELLRGFHFDEGVVLL